MSVSTNILGGIFFACILMTESVFHIWSVCCLLNLLLLSVVNYIICELVLQSHAKKLYSHHFALSICSHQSKVSTSFCTLAYVCMTALHAGVLWLEYQGQNNLGIVYSFLGLWHCHAGLPPLLHWPETTSNDNTEHNLFDIFHVCAEYHPIVIWILYNDEWLQ